MAVVCFYGQGCRGIAFVGGGDRIFGVFSVVRGLRRGWVHISFSDTYRFLQGIGSSSCDGWGWMSLFG